MKLTLDKKRVLVLGLGETGLSALRWLLKQGAHVTMADSRQNPPGMNELLQKYPQINLHTGPFEQAVLMQAELIVISPGVSLKEPAVQAAVAKGIPVVGDVELFALYRPASAKVIAITGSNGKTTVTSLVGAICQHAGLNTIVAGNIGLPVLDTLEMGVPEVYVLELSSFQLETTHHLKVDVATVLNISEDHMDRYHSMQEYAEAKGRIYNHATIAVVNRDDPVSLALTKTPHISFGLNAAENVTDFGLIDADGLWLASGKRKWMPIDDLRIKGLHNAANALAAAAICGAIGIEKSLIIGALREFKGLPHRVEWVASIDEVDFYDDSKGTNVGATCAAIMGMVKNGRPQKVVLIAGGDGKGQDFRPLADAVLANVRTVVLYGRDAPAIEQALLVTEIPIYDAIDLPEAVAIAQKLAMPGDAVLLSPACASLDMFRNYVHRAEVFVNAVQLLKARAC